MFLNRNDLETIPAALFDDLTSLLELNLSLNELTTLPAEIFDNLSPLVVMNLGGNSLATLPDGVFDGLTAALVHLDLGNNSLATLPAGVFDGLTGLTQLVLNSNQLDMLPSGLFSEVTSRTELILEGNSGAPFGPTAVAVPDDGRVLSTGGTVALDGSASDGGAWGTNVTYAWALTNPASVTGLTLADAETTTATVRAVT